MPYYGDNAVLTWKWFNVKMMMIWRWWEPRNRAFCPSMLASQKLQIKSNHHISMWWSSMRTWVVRKSVKIEGVSSIGISSTQMNSPTEVQPVWEDDDGDDDDDDGDGGDDDGDNSDNHDVDEKDQPSEDACEPSFLPRRLFWCNANATSMRFRLFPSKKRDLNHCR